ncbi:MAG: hypothetical protein J6S05_05365 [Bacteroidaceae bacterium]|nr:hypothetical protein [Bacteroidaceae bacterium]
MAKNAHKTNALGMELSPASFKTVEKEHTAPVEAPSDILANLETDKPVIKGFSFTLREDNVKKLRSLAKSRGVSASKMLDHILSEVIK